MTTMLRAGRNRASAFYAAIRYRRRYDLLLVLTLWGIVLPIGKAIAGQYKLIQGSGLPVCEAYRRNFESRHESEPMACEREYYTAIKGFEPVPWKKLDLQRNFELYREAEIDLATNVNSEQGAVLSAGDALQMANKLRGAAQHQKVELFVAKLPLFGGTRLSNILSLRELACGPIPKANVKISRLLAVARVFRTLFQSR